jgi:alpha-1,2-mannosyltransferase
MSLKAIGRERLAVALAVSTAAGIIVWVGLRALSLHPSLAGLLAVVGGALGAIRLARRLPVGLEGSLSRRPALCALWMVLALLALVQTARLSAFMADPGRTQHSLMPWNDWLTHHSCLTAYTEAARLSDEGKPNVYDPQIYSGRRIGGFRVDQFHYPPPFLLLPRALQAGLGG